MIRKRNKIQNIALLTGSIILLCIPLISILFFYTHKIHLLYQKDYQVEESIECVIYDVNLDGTILYIEGSIALLGVPENYTKENKYLYFKNNKSGEMYETRVGEMVIGEKMTEYIDDGNDYSISGFVAKIDINSLNIKDNSYSIYCCSQNWGINMIKDTQIDIRYGELIEH